MIAQLRGLEINTLAPLRERHFGNFDVLTAEEELQRYPAARACHVARDIHHDFESGEHLLRFAERVEEEVAYLSKHHPNQTNAAVSHAGVLEIVYRKATGRPLHTPRDFVIPNCALNWFSFGEYGCHLQARDDHHHLAKVMLESAE